MNNVQFRYATENDAALVLEFIKGIATYEKMLDEVGDGPDAPINTNQDELMDEFNKNYEDFEEKLADEIDKMLDEVGDGPDAPLDDKNEFDEELSDEDVDKLKEDMDDEFNKMLDELEKAASTSK